MPIEYLEPFYRSALDTLSIVRHTHPGLSDKTQNAVAWLTLKTMEQAGEPAVLPSRIQHYAQAALEAITLRRSFRRIEPASAAIYAHAEHFLASKGLNFAPQLLGPPSPPVKGSEAYKRFKLDFATDFNLEMARITPTGDARMTRADIGPAIALPDYGENGILSSLALGSAYCAHTGQPFYMMNWPNHGETRTNRFGLYARDYYLALQRALEFVFQAHPSLPRINVFAQGLGGLVLTGYSFTATDGTFTKAPYQDNSNHFHHIGNIVYSAPLLTFNAWGEAGRKMLRHGGQWGALAVSKAFNRDSFTARTAESLEALTDNAKAQREISLNRALGISDLSALDAPTFAALDEMMGHVDTAYRRGDYLLPMRWGRVTVMTPERGRLTRRPEKVLRRLTTRDTPYQEVKTGFKGSRLYTSPALQGQILGALTIASR